jgi:hypothetical protein
MQHGEVVLGAFLPADEQTAKAVEPGVGALNDPAPGAIADLAGERPDLLAASTQMKREAELGGQLAHLGVVVAFVEAKALRMCLAGHRSRDDDAFQRRPRQLVIVAVGARDADGYGDAGGVSKERAFRPLLARSVGFGPVAAPPRGALVMAPSSAR